MYRINGKNDNLKVIEEKSYPRTRGTWYKIRRREGQSSGYMKGIPKFTKVGGCGGCRMTTDTAMQQFLPRDAIHLRYYSHGPVSVCLCLSVTSRCSTKTAKRRITQTTPHDSPGTLVFWCQRSPRNSAGDTPYESTKCRVDGL